MTALEQLRAEIGVKRTSEWFRVDQSTIDLFADATRDHQFIHVDPQRAGATPFGGTIAHGFLTLSLLPYLVGMIEPPAGSYSMAINYGLDRLRFAHPVRAGSRIRANSTAVSADELGPARIQVRSDILIEIENVEKPALAATWLMLYVS